MDKKIREDLARALEQQRAEEEGREWVEDDTCVIDCVASFDVEFVGVPLGEETLLRIQIQDGAVIERSTLEAALMRAATTNVEQIMKQIDYVVEKARGEDLEDDYDS